MIKVKLGSVQTHVCRLNHKNSGVSKNNSGICLRHIP
jgi:hypothetical protein